MSKGILIDYGYCTDCQSCMMACQVEHDLPEGHQGIVINKVGVWAIDEDENKWQYDFVPALTDECDLCADRIRAGKEPTCVKHCLAAVMKFGEIEELAKELDQKPKQILIAPATSQLV